MTTQAEADDAVRQSRIKARDGLLVEYRLCMQRGTAYQRQATAMHNEAEQAAADYVQMKKDFRARPENEGVLPATADYKYGRYDVAQAAVKDNQWYMQRAIMFATLATMEFAKAEALMQNIARINAQL